MSLGCVVLDVRVFRALSSGTRVAILKLLLKRRATTAEVARSLGLSCQAVSTHLKRLCGVGLVVRLVDERRWVYYALSSDARYLVEPRVKLVRFEL